MKKIKGIEFFYQSNWRKRYKIFHIIPAISFGWDTQNTPLIREDGTCLYEGSKDFSLFFDWLWFSCGVTISFNFTKKEYEKFVEEDKERSKESTTLKNLKDYLGGTKP